MKVTIRARSGRKPESLFMLALQSAETTASSNNLRVIEVDFVEEIPDQISSQYVFRAECIPALVL